MLEPARKATAPTPPPMAVPAASKPAVVSVPVPSTSVAQAPVSPVSSPPPSPPRPAASATVPPIGGPSLLGLDQPNADELRERSFSGLASYAEPAESGGGKRVLLFLLLLALLGGAGWWTYTNYLSAATGRSPQGPVAPANAGTVDDDAAKSAKSDATEREDLPVRSAAPTAAPVVTPDPPVKKAPAQAESKSPKAIVPAPKAARHDVSATRPSAAPPAEDSGDGLFRRGERYLYGRGGAQDCVNAQKYLKMASEKQNAKARSAIGTMYATGHCVSRDLPSAYRWFALALRADPNNTVVEKNLSGVWNQMTPPERQLATKNQ